MRFFRRSSAEIEEFSVIIIRPSKYDDEGYVIRYWRGVLPSNTVATLGALTREAFESGRFSPGLKTSIRLMDDTVEDISPRRLARRHLGPGKRALVAFAGVQTNQFPRAADLALAFKEAGFETMVGGFHVSGSIAMSDTTPPELQELMDRGVTLVKGEVEERWGDLMEDAFHGRLKPYYDVTDKPDISKAPIPMVDARYQRRFLYPFMGTIDTSRGCPFDCSFCTIINVQGRQMRCRSDEAVLRQIEYNYRNHKVDYYFFTDDNFSRNRYWESILDRLIELRENEGINIRFMMQIDTKAWRIPRFVEKSARAGCSQVFLGVESLNPKNLESVNKRQNVVSDMQEMVAAWHEVGVACHAGYIIGFEHDTPESVAQDVERLKATGMDQCSFFMMTPLPGSADHARWGREGRWMSPDYNCYDSYHEALRLPGFAPGEWLETYKAAWRSFYSFDNMRAVLNRANHDTYWRIFKNFMWYLNAMDESEHPMVAGFWRLRPRADRRRGFPVEGRLRHFFRRTSDTVQTLRRWKRLFFKLQELWLQTRVRPETAASRWTSLRETFGQNVSKIGESLSTRAASVRDNLSARSAHARERLHDAASGLGDRVRAGQEQLMRPLRQRPESRLLRLIVAMNNKGRRRYITTREHLNTYWRQVRHWARQGRILRISLEAPRIGMNLLRDARLSATFFAYFLHNLTCE